MPSTEHDQGPDYVSPYLAASIRQRQLEQQQLRILKQVVDELRPEEHEPSWNRAFHHRLASLKLEKRTRRRRRIHSDRRRARIAGATIGPPIDRAAIIRRDKSTCHICGNKCEPNDIHLDHVIPLSKGGAHSPDNVKVAHARCNLDKRDLALSDLTSYTRKRRPA